MPGTRGDMKSTKSASCTAVIGSRPRSGASTIVAPGGRQFVAEHVAAFAAPRRRPRARPASSRRRARVRDGARSTPPASAAPSRSAKPSRAATAATYASRHAYHRAPPASRASCGLSFGDLPDRAAQRDHRRARRARRAGHGAGTTTGRPIARTGVTAIVPDDLAAMFRRPMAAGIGGAERRRRADRIDRDRRVGHPRDADRADRTPSVGRAYDAIVDVMIEAGATTS